MRHPSVNPTTISTLAALGALLGLLASAPLWAAEDSEDWDLKRNKQDIQVFTRSVAGSKFKAVRAKMQIDATVTELVALILDTEACSSWADLCKEARVHQQLSPTEFYVYTYNDVPWPVSDRDALAHVVWSQDPDTYAVEMTATATDGILEKTKGAVRLVDAVTGWVFTPLDNGSVEVTMKAHVNPAGPTPAWLTNMLLVDSPFKTMKLMRKLLASGAYRGASVNFVVEPPQSTLGSAASEASNAASP